jgi:polyhydroxybutyrate depolymerase
MSGLAIGWLGAVAPAHACDDRTPCMIEDGEYFARLPPRWDGRSPLPAVVFFHGYSGSSEGVMADAALGATLADAGILLVAPQGRPENGSNRSWSFPGKTFPGRDDFAFVRHVLDDVERRWPIDRSRVLASGFSVGGSMTWYVACLMPDRFTAFAPVAGAFWRPEPDSCPGGPVSLRHVHGLADPMVPMQGRPLRGGALHQGDVLRGMATWRAIDGCREVPDAEERRGPLACRTWSAQSCRSNRELVLCLHPGEHEIEAGWILDAFHWMEGLPAKARGSAAATTLPP